jgi:drug/metabolite transporter (DMT)-like permease
MFPVNVEEMVVIIIGLGIIIIPLLFRERLDTTFDLKKWLILLVLGVTIYAVYANPNNAFPKLTIPILAMVGLFVVIHF